MKPRLPLSWKVALLAIINVLLLTLVLLVFAGVQFRISPESFLVTPALDRILSVQRELALELADAPLSSRKELLDRFSRDYGVGFELVDLQGRSMSDAPVALPQSVLAEIAKRRDDPGRRFGPGGTRPIRGLESLVFRQTTGNPSMYWVGVRMLVRNGATRETTPGFLVLRSDSFIGNQFFFDPKPWIAVTLAVILASTIVWLPFIRGLTRAIAEMTRATGKIAEGQFETRVSIERGDEIGMLASSINRMTTQLSGFVKGQKRFLADIAHELCAPVARMQVALGILDQRAGEGQREYVADVLDEAQHMSALIAELMSFSKAGILLGETEIVPVHLAETVRRVIERESTPNAQIEISVPEDIVVLANPDYLLRALSNLVRNAIRYAGDAGPISIGARKESLETMITISDRGPGLPESMLEEVFKPFFRVERSRGRDMGGTGLGLAIVKACIEACKGTVRAFNSNPSGLSVEIRLPNSEQSALPPAG